MGHAEVAPDVLLGVGALLLADDRDAAAVDRGEAADDRRVVAEQPVAVELDELVGHGARAARACAAGGGCARAGRGPSGGRGSSSSRRPSGASDRSSVGVRARVAARPRVAQERKGRNRWTTSARGVGDRSRERRAEGDLVAQLGPGDDPVHEAVLEQELRALEPGGSSWPIVPARDARAGEADQRVGLGEVDVAQRRVDANDATGRRVGHDGDVRDAGLAQPLERRHVLASCISASVPSCIRAPPDARDDDERDPLVERGLRGAGDLLADDGAHRAAHEPEVHDARSRRACPRSGRSPRPRRRGVPVASCAAATRSGYAFWSTKPSGSTDCEARRRAPRSALVEELREAHGRREPEVVAAGRADAHRLLELLVEQLLLARRAAASTCLAGRRLAARAEGRELDRHQRPPEPGVVAAAARSRPWR